MTRQVAAAALDSCLAVVVAHLPPSLSLSSPVSTIATDGLPIPPAPLFVFSFFARHFSLLRPLRAPGASRIHAPLHGKTGDTIGYHVRAIISSRNSTSPTASTPAPAKQLGKTLLLARRRILRRIPRAPSLRPSFGDTSLPPSIRNDTAQFSNLTKLSRPFQDQTTSAQDQSPARFSHALGHPIQSSQRSRGVCRLLSSMVSSDR